MTTVKRDESVAPMPTPTPDIFAVEGSRETTMACLFRIITPTDTVVMFATSQKQAKEYKDTVLKTYQQMPSASTKSLEKRREFPTNWVEQDDDETLSAVEETARIPTETVSKVITPALGQKVEPLIGPSETEAKSETYERKHRIVRRRIYTSAMLQDEYNSPGYTPEWNPVFPMPAREAYFNLKCTIHEIENAKPIKGSYMNVMYNMKVDVPPSVVKDVVDSKVVVQHLAALTPHLVLSVGRELDDCDFHAIQPCHLGAIENPLGNTYRQRRFVHYKNKCWLLGAYFVNIIDNFFRNPKLLKNAKNYDWYPICMLGNRRSDGSSIVYDDVYFRFMKLAVDQPANTKNVTVLGHINEYNRRVKRFEDRASTKRLQKITSTIDKSTKPFTTKSDGFEMDHGFKSVETVSDDIDDIYDS